MGRTSRRRGTGLSSDPLLVGAAAVTQRDPADGRDALGLMVDAARAAAADAGAPELLAAVDEVCVPKGIWGHGDPGRVVADRVGTHRASTVLAEVGVLQQSLLTRACEAVASGRAEVVLVVGGEDRARARAQGESDPVGGQPDELLAPADDVITALEIERDLATPANQYALIEHALGHFLGRSRAEHAEKVARRWSRFSHVATTNPDAWSTEPVGVSTLVEPDAPNRWVARPYTKLHCSQWTVDQAAAVLVCSAGAARAAGVDPRRAVRPLAAAESNLMVALANRTEIHRSPACALAVAAGTAAAGVAADEIAHLDLYSCFPSAVGIQRAEVPDFARREDNAITVTGGMSFAGGPLNNAVLMAIPRLVERLRAEPGSVGAVTSVSGMFTKFGIGLFGGPDRHGRFTAVDVTGEARASTATTPTVSALDGTAGIVSWTVIDDRDGPARAVALVEQDGTRTVATTDDRALCKTLVTDGTDWCGTSATVEGDKLCGLA